LLIKPLTLGALSGRKNSAFEDAKTQSAIFKRQAVKHYALNLERVCSAVLVLAIKSAEACFCLTPDEVVENSRRSLEAFPLDQLLYFGQSDLERLINGEQQGLQSRDDQLRVSLARE
jgi:hypothetical protein